MMIQDILGHFEGKTIKGVVYDERYELQIVFTDDSRIKVEADGPDGSHISVEANCNLSIKG